MIKTDFHITLQYKQWGVALFCSPHSLMIVFQSALNGGEHQLSKSALNGGERQLSKSALNGGERQ